MTTLSPALTPTIYNRGQEKYGDKITRMEYEEWTLHMDKVDGVDDVTQYGTDLVAFHDELGTAYIGDKHAHVADSMYRSHPVVFLREYLAAALMYCRRNGVVDCVECTDKRDLATDR